jgi:transposase-like protein
MVNKNRYYKHSRISAAKFRQIVRHFCLDFTASDTAKLTGISVRSINAIYLKIRRRIWLTLKADSPLSGAVEVDESYFGPHRVKGKRGRGAGSKTIVFGILKRQGKVYTEVVPNCTKATLQAVIRGKVDLGTAIHSDGWRGYDGLVDLGFDKHFRVNHGEGEFARGDHHINGIESFWSYAKRRLAKFNGVPAKTFELHLKETEFRFNLRHDNLYLALLKLLRNNPL